MKRPAARSLLRSGAAAALLGVGCGNAGDAVKPTLADIQDKIFTPVCATSTCHGGMDDPKANPLDLRAGMAHGNLVGHASFWRPDQSRVKAGDPAASYLIETLTSPTPQPQTMKDGYTNDRMPSGCPTAMPCLSSGQLDAIRQWIAAGAPQQ